MRAAALWLLACLCLRAGLAAQDSDSVLLKNGDKKFSLVSQIEDASEASAFLAVLSAPEPAARYQLAQRFAEQYPQSWLLAQVYDVLARSAIDLQKYKDAIAAGRFSVRLLPENPSLLVLIANAEAQQKNPSSAIVDAGNALDYLDQVERLPNMTEAEWSRLRPQLKASAYFAKARAEASAGMAPGATASLNNAFNDLNNAAAWNPDDAEVLYLRAIVEIQLGQKSAAAADLAFVVKNSAALGEKARSILLILSKQMVAEAAPRAEFLKTLPRPIIDKSLRLPHEFQTDAQALAYGYAGPEACKGCHQKEYSAWRQTGMARMLQPYDAANMLVDFSSTPEYKQDGQTVRFGGKNRPYFEIFNLGTWIRYDVDFTIGSKWQQAFATRLPDGRLQVLPVEYNLLQKKWINYWKMIDPPGGSRANIQDFPKLTSATNYQQNCAICHTSQLRTVDSTAPSMEHATYLQPGIDCEMCHGPSALHAKQVAKSTPLDFRKVSNRDGVRVCAQCHRQSAVREMGQDGGMNYSTNGAFVPITWLRPYDAFSRKAFYKDGRFRETTFIVEAFTRSAFYRRGTAQCATCHSPHLGDFKNNQTSLKFKRDQNEMCLGCHSEFRNRISEHSRHLSNSEASDCVTCHMPRVANALLFQARSHQIEIPTADLTERFGQQESPNVCLTCHSEKTATWAKGQLAAWVR